MMSDYDRTMELIDAAYNSAGKSQQQFAKNMETIEFKTKRLKNSWETLRQSFVNSDFFKGAADSANNLLQSLNELSGWDYAALAATFLIFGKTVITNIVKGMSTTITTINSSIGNAFEKISQKIIPESLKLKIGLSSDSEQKIEELKQEINNLKEQKINIQADTTEAEAKVERLKARLEELNSENRAAELQSSINRRKQSMSDRISAVRQNLGTEWAKNAKDEQIVNLLKSSSSSENWLSVEHQNYQKDYQLLQQEQEQLQDLLSERGEIDQQLSETLQHIAENNGQIQDLNNNIEQDETSVLCNRRSGCCAGLLCRCYW